MGVLFGIGHYLPSIFTQRDQDCSSVLCRRDKFINRGQESALLIERQFFDLFDAAHDSVPCGRVERFTMTIDDLFEIAGELSIESHG